jgi:hypothetical protein
LPIEVEDHAVLGCGPGDLGVEFDGVTIVVFAFGEGLFGLFPSGDIDDGDGDSDDLVGFVAGGLEGDEKGPRTVTPMSASAACARCSSARCACLRR